MLGRRCASLSLLGLCPNIKGAAQAVKISLYGEIWVKENQDNGFRQQIQLIRMEKNLLAGLIS
jgi:hypothetical protein